MESEQVTDRRPLRDVVLELDNELRRRLDGVRLVMEAGLDDDTLRRVESAVTRLAAAQNGEAWLARKLPAVLLVHLVGTGSRLETGSFWPIASLGQFDQHELGCGFEEAIAQLNLEPFSALADEGALRFVAPILAHGGIPPYAADSFIDILVGTLRRYGMTTAVEVVAFWRSRHTALDFGQRPIRRFLLYGGEPALDYLGRCIEMARLDANEVRTIGPGGLGIPDHIVQAYLAYAERVGEARTGVRAGPALPRARVAIDPFDGAGPYMELPLVPAALGQGTWFVDDGTSIAALRTSALETRRVALAPSLSWSAELRLDDGTVRTTLFEALGLSPYVCFESETGSYVDDLRPVALEQCWLLAPREATVTAQDSTGKRSAALLLTDMPDPSGSWAGYSIRHIALLGVGSLSVVNHLPTGDTTEGRIHVVGTENRPQLLGAPVHSVTTGDGAPVYARPPALVIPRLAGFADDRWTITTTVRGVRRTEHLSDVGSSGVELPLAQLLPSQPVGMVDLVVRGPLGSDLRRRFAVVADLAVDVPPQLLLPGDEFGRTITVHAQSAVELSVPSTRQTTAMGQIPIPQAGDRIAFSAAADGGQVDLVVRLARLMWTIRRRGIVPQLEAQRKQIDADDLVEGAVETLLVSTLVDGMSLSLSLEDGATMLQRLPPGRTAPPEGRWAISLAGFRDTVRTAPSSRLTLALEIDRRRVPVADVVATAKATDIRVGLVQAPAGRRVQVRFTEARRLANRVVRLWSCDRPWLPPIVQSLPDGDEGVVLFAPGDVGVGRYRAEIAVDDPWFAPHRPAAGAPSTADVAIGDPDELRALGVALESSGAPDDLVALAVVTGLPPHEFGAGQVATAWPALAGTARALMADALVDEHYDRQLKAVVRLMTADPRQMMEQLAIAEDGTTFEPIELLRLFLIARPPLGQLEIPAAPDRILRALWRSCAPFAALADVPLARAGDPDSIARCEEHLGWTPSGAPPPTGRRPELAELSLSPARLATIRDLLGLVPRVVLSWDTYQVACFEWLARCASDQVAAERWRVEGSGLADGLSLDLDTAEYLEARRGVAHPDYIWADGLRLSLACAMHLAAADGLAQAASDALEDLLSISPRLVTYDLVLAQVMITPGAAATIRDAVPPSASPDGSAADRRWEALIERARSASVAAFVEYVAQDGVVLANVDGFQGRVKPHERGWTTRDRERELHPGQQIEVVVRGSDSLHRRLELSIRHAEPSPWLDPCRLPVPGDILDVVVSRVQPYGLFVTTAAGLDGLVHHSQLEDRDLPDDPDARLEVLTRRYPTDQSLRARVLDIDPTEERMTMSTRLI